MTSSFVVVGVVALYLAINLFVGLRPGGKASGTAEG
jgi:hypothetical protein